MTDREELADAFVTASRALVGVAVHSVSAAPVEITVTQFRLLVLVADSQRSIGDIADHLGINQSNASRHCDRLERLGLVDRQRLEADARVVVVGLTGKGRTVVEAVMARRRDDVSRLLGALSPHQSEALVQALEAFNRAATEFDEAPWMRVPW